MAPQTQPRRSKSRGLLLALLVVSMPASTGCNPAMIGPLLQALAPLLSSLMKPSTPTTPTNPLTPAANAATVPAPQGSAVKAPAGTTAVFTNSGAANQRLQLTGGGATVSTQVDVPPGAMLVFDTTAKTLKVVTTANPTGTPATVVPGQPALPTYTSQPTATPMATTAYVGPAQLAGNGILPTGN